MKNIVRNVASILALSLSFSALAQNQCAKISCDCQGLPTASWTKTCVDQEARLIADCVKTGVESGQYCSIHGPMANRLPLDLKVDLANLELVAVSDIPKLNNKVAVLYWAIIKDFDSFEVQLKQGDFIEAKRKLDTINANVDSLFKAQLEVTESFRKEDKASMAQLAWRDYSADTLSFGSDFFIRAESLLNSYDTITNNNEQENVREIAIKLMVLSGKVYEQVGFGYGSGMRHKHAAKAWKNAADASSLVMAHQSEKVASTNGGFYRFQSAARLHRASFHWLMGSGRGSADGVLAESQKFMDDGSTISGIVEEEKRIQSSKPSWTK